MRRARVQTDTRKEMDRSHMNYDSMVLHLQSSRSRTTRQTSCPSATKTGSVSTNFENETRYVCIIGFSRWETREGRVSKKRGVDGGAVEKGVGLW